MACIVHLDLELHLAWPYQHPNELADQGSQKHETFESESTSNLATRAQPMALTSPSQAAQFYSSRKGLSPIN